MSRIGLFSFFLSFYLFLSPISFASTEGPEENIPGSVYFFNSLPPGIEVTFEGQELTEEAYKKIGILLEGNSSVSSLNFQECPLGDVLGKDLSSTFATMMNLAVINVSNMGMTCEGAKALYGGLKQGHPSLQRLDVSGNTLDSKSQVGLFSLQNVMNEGFTLYIGSEDIYKTGLLWDALTMCRQENKSAEFSSDNTDDPSGSEIFFRQIPAGVPVAFDDCNLTEEDYQNLGQFLRMNEAVRVLSFCNCPFGDTLLSNLSRSFSLMPNLESLNLRGIEVTSVGFAHLYKGLQEKVGGIDDVHFECLDVSGTHLQPELLIKLYDLKNIHPELNIEIGSEACTPELFFAAVNIFTVK